MITDNLKNAAFCKFSSKNWRFLVVLGVILTFLTQCKAFRDGYGSHSYYKSYYDWRGYSQDEQALAPVTQFAPPIHSKKSKKPKNIDPNFRRVDPW